MVNSNSLVMIATVPKTHMGNYKGLFPPVVTICQSQGIKAKQTNKKNTRQILIVKFDCSFKLQYVLCGMKKKILVL